MMSDSPALFLAPNRLSPTATSDAYLAHLASCARDPALGPLAAHLYRVPEPEQAPTTEPAPSDEDAPEPVTLPPDPLRRVRYLTDLIPGFDWNARSGSDRHPAGALQDPSEFDLRRDLMNLVSNAHTQRIVFEWSRGPDQSVRGSVWRPPGRASYRRNLADAPEGLASDDLRTAATGGAVIYLAPGLRHEEVFEVLLHELAHLLLGHVGPDPVAGPTSPVPTQRRVGTRTVREVEADGAASVVGLRRKGTWVHGEGNYLRSWFDHLRSFEKGFVDVVRTFIVAEILTAWCRTKPGRAGVLRGPAGGPRVPMPRRAKKVEA